MDNEIKNYNNEKERNENKRNENEDVSFGGRGARYIVKTFNHLPGIGSMAQNGEIRRLLTDREKVWLCPHYLKREVIDFENFSVERIFNEKKRHHGKRVIFQIHGGGYYGRLNNAYRDLAVLYHEITSGMDVVSLDYRVAPEYAFPAALDDAVEAYRWLIDNSEAGGGYKAENVIFTGDSAGGGLALATVLYLRDIGAPLPKGIITMSAWTDLSKRGSSYEEQFEKDPVFGGSKDTLVYKEGYIKGSDPENPYISPVNGDYKGFPPMLMQVGELEMLLSDTLSVAKAARDAGVEVTEHVYKGMFHIFQMGKMHYKESKEAWMEVAEFVRELYRQGKAERGNITS